MEERIPLPTMGEILQEEFMGPLGLSAYRVAKDIHVPVSRIQDILHDRRKMTADTSMRLGKYFGMHEEFFLEIQNDIDFRNLKETIGADIDSIQPYKSMQA